VNSLISSQQAFVGKAKPDCWSDFEMTVLCTISRSIPVVATSQAPVMWLGDSKEKPLHTLRQLYKNGWLDRFTRDMAPPQLRSEPRLIWKPGDSRPPLERLVSEARREVRNAARQLATLYAASRLTASLFGGDYLGKQSPSDLEQLARWSELYTQLSNSSLGGVCHTWFPRTKTEPRLPERIRYSASDDQQYFAIALANTPRRRPTSHHSTASASNCSRASPAA